MTQKLFLGLRSVNPRPRLVQRLRRLSNASPRSFRRVDRAAQPGKFVQQAVGARAGSEAPCRPAVRAVPPNVSDKARSTSPLARRSFTHAVLRPSERLIRRSTSSSSTGIPASSNTARAGCASGRSNTATTSPCSAPARTKSARPRQPNTNPRLSRRMDLPAPVSPVSTFRPGWNSSSNRSMISISRMSRDRSILSPVSAWPKSRQAGHVAPPDQSHSPLIIWR